MKKPDYKQLLSNRKEEILHKINNGGVVTFYNYKNWIKHEIFNENKTLFPKKIKDREYNIKFKLNYVYLENQQNVIDYMINAKNVQINKEEVFRVHEMLCENTDIAGGLLRYENKRLPGLNILPPDYDRVAHKMDTVYEYLADDSLPVISKALKAHFDIIAIQPFQDYNKRTARLIMNWILFQNGFTPILFNRKKDRDLYLDALAIRTKNRTEYDNMMLARFMCTQEEAIRFLNQKR